jgi:hypothetical protein
MYVLVPEEPMFLARFNEAEAPLLYELYNYYLPELESAESELIRAAYEAWADIHQRLPPALQWRELPPDGVPEAPGGYVLHDPSGRRQLTSLYPVHVHANALETLRACHTMLAWAERTEVGPLADVLSAIHRAPQNRGKRPLDSLRRALDVLELKAAPQLVDCLRGVIPTGQESPVVAITLRADQYAAYQALCEQIADALSAGDDLPFLRMLYAS